MTLDQRIEALENEIGDLEESEPDCTCERIDVDRYSALYCELCNPESRWRTEHARLTAELKRLKEQRDFRPAREDTDYEYALEVFE